jgi:hypothetical protein
VQKLKNRLTSFALVVLATACGQTPSHRMSEQTQNESNSQEARNELLPAIGRFEGEMSVYSSNKTYKAVLDATIIYQVIPSPQDPAQTISIPKISGTLNFPILHHTRDYDKYEDLMGPMAFYIMISFNTGDFDPRTGSFNLPYAVPESPNTIWGELQGQLIDDVFTGKWMTKVDGIVGDFKLVRTTPIEPPK